MPKVSVIVPNFNHASFLERRLDSVFNQTFDDFEVILLDDKSADNSLEVMSRYASHPKVSHFIVSESNSGSAFRQWAKGIRIAKGELIWIAESDDWAEPEFLETLVSAFDGGTNIALAYCRILRTFKDGSIDELCSWGEVIHKERWQQNFVCWGNEFIENYLIYRNVIVNASAVLFKRDVALNHLEEIIHYRYCGDWLFWALMVQGRQLAFVAHPLSYFRRYESATSLKNVRGKIAQRFFEYQMVINRLNGLVRSGKEKELNQYEWIVREWMSKRNYMSFVRYFLFPPLNRNLHGMFYRLWWNSLWSY